MSRKGSWLATYVEQYSSAGTNRGDSLFMVAYRLNTRPSRMFYYRLERLLTVVGGRRIQKSVVLVPSRAVDLVKELCRRYGAEVFEAPYGSKFGSD
jgi:hypothetical protein